MKKLSLITLLFLCTLLNAEDFKTMYHEMDSLPNINRLVYGQCISPLWRDSVSFVYSTYTPDGMVYYDFNVISKEKNPIEKGEFDGIFEKNRHVWKEREVPSSYISPDGLYEALLKDSNVWLKKISEDAYIQISFDGTENDRYNELFWSPDSKKIAATKLKDAPMHRIPLIQSSPDSQKQPVLQWRDYYKPGDLIPTTGIALFDVSSQKQIQVDNRAFENQYDLFFRRWRDDSKGFVFDFNQRGHQVYQIVYVDGQTGDTRILIDERSDTFIDYSRVEIRFLKNSDELIWSSERNGWRHLYLIDALSGRVMRQLTDGEWVVRGIEQVNEDNNYLIIKGNGLNKNEDPYNIHYYKLYLNANKAAKQELFDLTPEEGNHTAVFSGDKKYFVDKFSTPYHPEVTLLRSSDDGENIMEIESADITKLLETGWKAPEVFVSKGRDGKTDIWGNIYYPYGYKPNKKYKVIEYIYAGPHDSFVEKNFRAYERYTKLQKMGFFVVTIDGMGTNNRSKAFHDVCWRDLKDSGFPDRELWIKDAASKHKGMDISDGVGIYGYSAGGQSTLAALLFFNDFYKVGVALCGCHDNRMDKIWWNEQWMGYPIGPWYSESSNVDNAYRLEGKLLLINGELDDNVDPASTLQVVNALIKADKDFKQFYLPGYTHNLGDNYVTRKIYEFFHENMK